MLIKIYPENPNQRDVEKVVKVLLDGGVIIYPTDTIYGMGCDIFNIKAVERVAKLKGIDPDKANFSFICYDFSHAADFVKPLHNDVFRLMKRNLPGPFTFLLPAASNAPKLSRVKKKVIGIRIPDNSIIREVVRVLGRPIMSTSIHDEDDLIEYTTDPELIHEKFQDRVDLVIDGGYGNNVPSTIVSCVNDTIEVTRQGLGELRW